MSAVEPVHLVDAQLVGPDRFTDTERAHRDLEVAVAGFLARYRVRSTRAGYATSLRQWVEFCGVHFIDPLRARRGDIELWARKLEEIDGLKPSSVANKLNALSGFYRIAHADGFCESNPMRESPREGLTRTELFDLVTAAEGDPRDYALVSIGVPRDRHRGPGA